MKMILPVLAVFCFSLAGVGCKSHGHSHGEGAKCCGKCDASAKKCCGKDGVCCKKAE